jgi:hypothetical protein
MNLIIAGSIELAWLAARSGSPPVVAGLPDLRRYLWLRGSVYFAGE